MIRMDNVYNKYVRNDIPLLLTVIYFLLQILGGFPITSAQIRKLRGGDWPMRY